MNNPKFKKPKKFKTEEQFIGYYIDFVVEVIENNFEVFPSLTQFAIWYSQTISPVNVRTVYNTASVYFPTSKKRLKDLIGDVLAEGCAKGYYNPTMGIFALKNWCNWADKPESDTNEELMQKLDDVLAKVIT